MKVIGVFLAALLVSSVAYATPIADVTVVDDTCYPLAMDAQVTVEGLVTCAGPELGSAGPAYMEDETGGVAVYYYPIADLGLTVGDYIQVTGWIGFFNGLIEIVADPVTSAPPEVTILSQNNPVVPTVITIPEMDDIVAYGPGFDEVYEGMLVKLLCVTFVDAGGVFEYNGVYDIMDGSGNVGVMFCDGNTDIDGTTIPSGWVNITGDVGSYIFGPYCGGYQIIPRSLADIEYAPSATENVSWSGVKALYR